MSAAKLLGGAAVGAYAYNRAQETGYDSVIKGFTKSLTGIDVGSSSSGRGSGETQVLQSEVDRLHKLLADAVRTKGNGYTVIHSGRSGWGVIVIPTCVAGGAIYLYCRLTGKSLMDLLFVTNRSLSEFKASVTESIKVVWEEMKRQKDEMLNRMGLLGDQQDKLMKQQEDMDTRLREVGQDVLDVRYTADDIKNDVGKLRDEHTTNMQTMFRGLERANHGIHALCAAVADVTRRIGMDSENSRALESFIDAPAKASQPLLQSAQSSGLACVLTLEDAPKANGSTAPELPPLLDATRNLQSGKAASSASGRGAGMFGGLGSFRGSK